MSHDYIDDVTKEAILLTYENERLRKKIQWQDQEIEHLNTRLKVEQQRYERLMKQMADHAAYQPPPPIHITYDAFEAYRESLENFCKR